MTTAILKYKVAISFIMPFYVLKLGGSLLDCARDLIRALCSLTMEGYSFLVVPGGGPMADLVRDLFSRHEISQEAAHWMAILAMEQYAYFLADGTGAKLTVEIGSPKDHSIKVLLPYQALLHDDSGLRHNWDFTSDSVAALVALRLDAQLIKATDVDGVILEGKVIEEISPGELIGKVSCIDQGSLQILQAGSKGISAWVLNGTDASRFINALRRGNGGTIIRD
jgi:hypothetical protein